MWTWIKEDVYQLMYCASGESQSFVPLRENVLDLIEQGHIDKVVEAIYQYLRGQGLQYALEPPPKSEHGSSTAPTQDIRTPAEIFGSNPKRGTCLDLALLFCGVCLGYGLLPVLILLEEHALAAVSLNFDLRRWERRRPNEQFIFDRAVVGENKAEALKKLLVSGSYLAVECTGFARSHTLSLNPTFPEGFGRESEGDMSFERATTAGLEHFYEPNGICTNRSGKRKFLYAIDYGNVYRGLAIDPFSDDDKVGRPFHRQPGPDTRPPERDPLPYLLNRNEPESKLLEAILRHRRFARQRPLVCLIHGDELECHDDFLNRLQEFSLPKILGLWDQEKAKEEAILRVTMEPSFDQLGGENWEDVLWGDLAAGTIGVRDAPPDAIINLICRRKLAVIIDAAVLSEKMNRIPVAKLDLFLQFWNQWQNVSEDLLLIVCLNLKYQRRFENTWKIWRRSLNNKLRRYVKELNFGTFENIQGVGLQLDPISQTDATAAVKRARAMKSTGVSERDVIRLYNQPGLSDSEGRISMFHVLEYLTVRQAEADS